MAPKASYDKAMTKDCGLQATVTNHSALAGESGMPDVRQECSKPQNGRQSMAMKVWRKGEELVHDACFDANEDRSAYTPVDLNTLDEDDMCEVCSGEFLSGPDVDEDDDDDDDDEKPEAS
jgi:hypothetical protein